MAGKELTAMEKISYNYKTYVKKAFSYITRALERGDNLQRISESLRGLVNSYSGLNRNERYRLYSSVYTVCRAARSSGDWRYTLSLRKNFDSVLTTSRKVKASSELRHKRQETRAALRDEDTIFFLCSKHSNPAKDHAEWQNKVFYDRYWRQKVSGKDYYSVFSYIKNHNLVSVQEIMGPPVYLITRPFCGHYFIELETEKVLHSSLNSITKEIDSKRVKHYSTNEYYDFRSKVYKNLNSISPCPEFEKKIRRG